MKKKKQKIISITNIFPKKENNRSLLDEIKSLKKKRSKLSISCGNT